LRKKMAKDQHAKANERRIDNLLNGAIDPHVHSGPSIAPRAVDHLELLRDLSAAGFAAVAASNRNSISWLRVAAPLATSTVPTRA
jgi:hypothetical protein